MKVYLNINDNEIISVATEQIDNFTEIEINSMEDFYREIKMYEPVSEEIEEEIKELMGDDEESSLGTFKIKHWSSNRSFGELLDMYENGEINKPEMQREFVWDSLKCSRLIESIVMGLPIPPLFLLEIEDNVYELIDGLQRITTVYNFVNEKPWHGRTTGKRVVKARLSKKISKELQGRSYSELSPEYQRMIKRSTIPLIEFKQFHPNDISSKYLIFERINTGSEKLNQMQIRKSLAYGLFIKDLYETVNENELFMSLFSGSNIKKDQHIEAYLRTYVVTKIAYGQFKPKKSGINNILNEYCEMNRTEKLDVSYNDKLNDALTFLKKVFEVEERLFRRIELDKNSFFEYAGNMNISILESLLGTIIEEKEALHISEEKIENNYKEIMYDTLKKAIEKKHENPFTTSTGSLDSIKRRYEICRKIIEV